MKRFTEIGDPVSYTHLDVYKRQTHFREVERLFSRVRFHLFIVSDGSRRGYEPETIDRLRQLIPDVCVVDYKPNRGKGYALREAVKRCTSPYIIYTDYDFPYTNDSFCLLYTSI